MKQKKIDYIIKVIMFVITLISISTLYCYASEPSNVESKLKAAFIYNFTKFVEWPSSADNDITDQPFIIGILGHDPLAKELTAIEGKTIKGRKLSVKTLSNMRQINGCHVIFISDSEQDNLGAILKTLKNKNILTVSGISNFAENGGIIEFVRVDNKIRFDINLKTANRSGLKIRSDLLALARKIIN